LTISDAKFCFVVGADEVTGLHLIEACGGDVAVAIGMHMDTVGSVAAPGTSVKQNANREPMLAAHPSFSGESSSSEVYVSVVC